MFISPQTLKLGAIMFYYGTSVLYFPTSKNSAERSDRYGICREVTSAPVSVHKSIQSDLS